MRRAIYLTSLLSIIILLLGCTPTAQSEYTNLVNSINGGKLLNQPIESIDQHLQRCELVGDYKDNDKVKSYLLALKSYKQNNFASCSSAFSSIPNDYSGDIAKGVNDFQVAFKEKAIPEVEKLIKEKRYTDAKIILNPIKNIKELNDLWNYTTALIELENDYKTSGAESLYKISYFYKGPLAEEIKRTRAEFEADPMNKYIIKNAKPDPVLGMTMYEAEFDSSWGTPEKRNISKGSYGVHEQWVYGSGKYLYIENGIVTGIDESK